MKKRVVVSIDDDLAKKLYDLQAKQIQESLQGISFSSIVNEILRKALK